MKLAHLLPELEKNIRLVLKYYNIRLEDMDGGKTGLKGLYNLLYIVSENLAYDDNHPFFVNKKWPRILPYDGRDYCYFYENGANDSHVETLLKKIKQNILS